MNWGTNSMAIDFESNLTSLRLTHNYSLLRNVLFYFSRYVYFFDTSPYKETEDRRDFRWSLSQLREIHLRRFNLRRTGIEFFLVNT